MNDMNQLRETFNHLFDEIGLEFLQRWLVQRKEERFAALLCVLEDIALDSLPAETVLVAVPEIACENIATQHDATRICCSRVPLMMVQHINKETDSNDGTLVQVNDNNNNNNNNDEVAEEDDVEAIVKSMMKSSLPSTTSETNESNSSNEFDELGLIKNTLDSKQKESHNDQSSLLGALMRALRDSKENSVAMWPPAADYEQTVAQVIGAEKAAEAMQTMRHGRSSILLQLSINLLLLNQTENI